MKKIYNSITWTLLLISTLTFSQVQKAETVQVGNNTSASTMNPTAALQIDDTTRGFLGARMTTAQRTAIGTPATGLQVYDTDTNSLWLYNGTAWINAASSSDIWSKNGNSGTNSASDFIGTTDNKSLSFRTNNTQRMVIDTLGQIGIGRSIPRAKFDLYKGDLVLADTLGLTRGSRYQIQAYSSTTGAKFMAPWGYRSLFTMGMDIDDKPTGHNTDEILFLQSGTVGGNTNNYGGFRSIDNQFNLGGSGTVGDFVGYHSELNNGASALTNFTGMRLWLATQNTGTTTNLYGLDIRDWSSAGNTSNKYGIYLGGMSPGTASTYSIYSSGNYAAYFEGNMGLGTSSPTEKLQVQGNISLSGALMPNNNAGSTGQVLTSNGAGTAPTWSTPSVISNIFNSDGTLSANRIVTQGTKNLAFTSSATTGTSHFTIDGTTLNVDAVNNRIGIGTSNPTATLDVVGTAKFNGGANISSFLGGSWIDMPTSGPSGIGSGGAGNNAWLAYVASAGQWFGNSASGDIVFRNTSGKLLFGNTITNASFSISNDKIGIGNNSPTEKLDVTGNVKFSGALMPNNTAGTSGQVLTSAGAGATPTWTNLNTNIYSGNGDLTFNRYVRQGVYTLNFSCTPSAGTSHFTVDGTTFNVDAINKRIGINNNAPSYTLDVNGNLRSTGIILAASKIGIGTVNPAYSLDVVGDISSTGMIRGTTGMYFINSGGQNIAFRDGTWAGSNITYASNSLSFSQNDNSGSINFSLNGAVGNKLFNFTGGSLGIGVTGGATSTLHTNGTFALTTATSGTSNSVVLLSTGTFTPPSASTVSGRVYIIRNTSSASNVSIASVIDYGSTSATTVTITPAMGSLMIISDGTSWFRIN